MINLMTDEELMKVPAGSVFVFDVECYINFFYIAFKCLENGKFVTFEQSPDFEINKDKLLFMLWRFCLVGFNSKNYDLPIIQLCLKGANCKELKEASNFIIQGQNKVFAFEKQYKIKLENFNNIDLIEVAPLEGSLKLYAGRLNCQKMQDLPYKEYEVLTQEMAEVIRLYCCNDLSNTELLFNELASEIKLRIEMSEKYGIDLRSKSDAQVAEAVINHELRKITGNCPKRPIVKEGTVLKYNLPDFISFKSDSLNNALKLILNSDFELDGCGSPLWPKGLGVQEKGKKSWVLKVKIGNSVYKIGMGGLHSTEKNVAHFATDEIILSDNDVESYYPRIILNQKLKPEHLGQAFLDVYENQLVNPRIQAKSKASECKKKKDFKGAKHYKGVADSLKITINGSFGKLGNKYSTLYSPQLMLQVTITGQLSLLMLIEMMEDINIDVVSGNTDGIILKYHKSRNEEVRNKIKEWEKTTNFKTEETRYKEVLSRDVNSYIAIKEEEGNKDSKFLDERLSIKTKGAFCERGSALNSILSKNPETLICIDAVLQLVKNNIPIEETINNCKDIKRFVSVRNVKGGGQKDGVYLGKVVRWYYAKNEKSFISYVGSGNKVAKTDGAKPLMELPESFPADINYEWYYQTTIDLLFDCGFYKKPTIKMMF